MPVITTHVRGSTSDTRGEPAVLPIDITYCTDDPHALRFDFHTSAEEPATWLLSVEAFEWAFNNCNQAIGGDVTVKLCSSNSIADDTVSVHLRSDVGEAIVLIPADELKAFITRVQKLATNEAKERALNAMMQGIAAFLAEW